MTIQTWSDDITMVDLPTSQEGMLEDLKEIIKKLEESKDFDVVMDFSVVDEISSGIIDNLVELKKALDDCGHRMILSAVASKIKDTFTATGNDGLFEIEYDKFVALATLNTSG